MDSRLLSPVRCLARFFANWGLVPSTDRSRTGVRVCCGAAYIVVALGLAFQGVVPPAARTSGGSEPRVGRPIPWDWRFEAEDGTLPAKYEPVTPVSDGRRIFEA